jgi:membrane protein implicated in regulation of membrane protease activity
MDINLTDWLGTHLWLLWAALAVLFVALELLRRDRTMLVLTAGAVAAMVTALIVRQAWWWQIVVGLVVSVAGSVYLSRRTRRGGRPETVPPPSA